MTPNPAQPQSNMLHLYFPAARECVVAARDRIAEEHGVWLFGGVNDGPLPQQSYAELYVGDALIQVTDERVIDIFTLLDRALQPA
jgi:hypothetical protein